MSHDKRKQQAIIASVRAISSYINNVSESISAPYELSALQTRIILDIFNNPKKSKITDICKRMNKGTNTISPIVNRLISKDYLCKKQDKIDGRIMHVKLTDKSLELISSLKLDVEDFVWPIFDDLTQEEFDMIYKSFKILKEKIEG